MVGKKVEGKKGGGRSEEGKGRMGRGGWGYSEQKRRFFPLFVYNMENVII